MSLFYFSVNLKRYRQDRDLSQADLAEATGLKQKYISELERGLLPRDVEDVARLARALETTPADLLKRPRSLPRLRAVLVEACGQLATAAQVTAQ